VLVVLVAHLELIMVQMVQIVYFLLLLARVVGVLHSMQAIPVSQAVRAAAEFLTLKWVVLVPLIKVSLVVLAGRVAL